MAILGLLLVGVLVGSLVADVYTVPDVPCEQSGGDMCVLFRITASDLTHFLLLAVLGWLGVAVGFVLRARPEALNGLRRHFASAPARERRAATAAGLASAVVLVTTVVLVSG